MNKLLILLLLSTPLLAEDIRIENKILENSQVEMIFMSDGNYAQELKEGWRPLNSRDIGAPNASVVEVDEGVWERQGNSITFYIRGIRCLYAVKQIADTYVFQKKAFNNMGCWFDQILLKETEWSKANYNIINAVTLPKLKEYKKITD